MSSLLKNQNSGKDFLNRRYNVEYELGNGKVQTFSNVLENVDGVYFWFCSPEDGMDIVRQDRIVTMICIDKNNSKTI
jgi:hypothetical protein